MQKEKVGIKEIKEVLIALEAMGIIGMKIANDKKVDLADIPHVVSILKKFDMLEEAVKGSDKILEEFKDLDESEVVELVTMLFSLVRNIKKAKA